MNFQSVARAYSEKGNPNSSNRRRTYDLQNTTLDEPAVAQW